MSLQIAAQPDTPKAMSFRTTVGQHQQMAEAANQQGVSLNKWMNQALAEAVTNSPCVYDFPVPETKTIRAIAADPDNNIELVSRLVGLLKDRSHRGVLHFSHALGHYLSGLDAIWPYWNPLSTQAFEQSCRELDGCEDSLVSLTKGLAAPLEMLCSARGGEAAITDISQSLNLYMAGLYEVMPYFAQPIGAKAEEFLNLIKASIQEIEQQGRLTPQDDEFEKEEIVTRTKAFTK